MDYSQWNYSSVYKVSSCTYTHRQFVRQRLTALMAEWKKAAEKAREVIQVSSFGKHTIFSKWLVKNILERHIKLLKTKV